MLNNLKLSYAYKQPDELTIAITTTNPNGYVFFEPDGTVISMDGLAQRMVEELRPLAITYAKLIQQD
jgi:hypothetical protein